VVILDGELGVDWKRHDFADVVATTRKRDGKFRRSPPFLVATFGAYCSGARTCSSIAPSITSISEEACTDERKIMACSERWLTIARGSICFTTSSEGARWHIPVPTWETRHIQPSRGRSDRPHQVKRVLLEIASKATVRVDSPAATEPSRG
jgi:hypothetical protein